MIGQKSAKEELKFSYIEWRIVQSIYKNIALPCNGLKTQSIVSINSILRYFYTEEAKICVYTKTYA